MDKNNIAEALFKVKHAREIRETDNYFVVVVKYNLHQFETMIGWIEESFDEEQFKEVVGEKIHFEGDFEIKEVIPFGKHFDKGREYILHNDLK